MPTTSSAYSKKFREAAEFGHLFCCYREDSTSVLGPTEMAIVLESSNIIIIIDNKILNSITNNCGFTHIRNGKWNLNRFKQSVSLCILFNIWWNREHLLCSFIELRLLIFISLMKKKKLKAFIIQCDCIRF